MQYGKSSYELGSYVMEGVCVKDIAHSLSQINRYNGHSYKPLSVARHSMYVSHCLDLDPMAALYGLCHDVAETVTGDISFPVKQYLRKHGSFAAIEQIEEAAEAALFNILGIPYPMGDKYRALVKHADWSAAGAEKRDLMLMCDRSWDMLAERPGHVTAYPTMTPADDCAAWLGRYADLALHLKLTPKGG